MTQEHGPSQRQLRVGEEMRHTLARIFGRGELRDPALHDAALTVTEVRVSPDLKRATAYVMPLGGRNAAEIMAGLKRGAGHLRRLVAQEVKLRVAPQILFALDQSFDEASRIDALLRREDVARDLAADEPADKDHSGEVGKDGA
ncbi:MAG TPA: 30S ribosome-binding factor RbfA [Stellaceae bacterium]|nr:30S ribosome-binding factor RbfA [Stellaceae bacterium]